MRSMKDNHICPTRPWLFSTFVVSWYSEKRIKLREKKKYGFRVLRDFGGNVILHAIGFPYLYLLASLNSFKLKYCLHFLQEDFHNPA